MAPLPVAERRRNPDVLCRSKTPTRPAGGGGAFPEGLAEIFISGRWNTRVQPLAYRRRVFEALSRGRQTFFGRETVSKTAGRPGAQPIFAI